MYAGYYQVACDLHNELDCKICNNYDWITFSSPMNYGTTTLSYTTGNFCKHGTGWYGQVDFWLFSKQIYTCSDCGKMLEGKALREFKADLK